MKTTKAPFALATVAASALLWAACTHGAQLAPRRDDDRSRRHRGGGDGGGSQAELATFRDETRRLIHTVTSGQPTREATG